jgi:lipopolysaccharide transport system permease protein
MTPVHELVIEAGRTERQYWRDLWRYRELFYFLAWRDILVRYKQTFVGIAWALLRPAVTVVILTMVFGRLAKMPSEGVPYPLLVLCGMLPWQFFATAVSESGNSLVTNTQLISKIYFPRMAIPATSLATSFVDFVVSGAIMMAVLAWYQYVPGFRVLTLPLFISLAVAAAFGVGLWFSALTVRYRDMRHVVPFLAQFGLYVSPVGFTSNAIPDQWRLVYSLNPVVGVIDGFRWSILGEPASLYFPGLLLSVLVSGILLFTGIRYFRKTERTFADII